MIVALVVAFAAAAPQSAPPYLQFMEEAEALGRASYMGGFCKGMGIVTSDQAAFQDIADDFIRRATIAQVDGPVLRAAIDAGIQRERQAIELMADLGPDDGSERRRRREDQAADYFGKGCADLTINYPSAFQMVDE